MHKNLEFLWLLINFFQIQDFSLEIDCSLIGLQYSFRKIFYQNHYINNIFEKYYINHQL